MSAGGPPLWTEKYLGIPFSWAGESFDGANCWGLARLILRDQTGIELNSFSDGLPDRDHIDDMTALFESQAPFWNVVWERTVPGEPTPMNWAQPFDLLWQKVFGRPHVSVVVSPDWAITTIERQTSHFARLTGEKWKSRTLGIFRHPSRM